jgi:hypothetical protein
LRVIGQMLEPPPSASLRRSLAVDPASGLASLTRGVLASEAVHGSTTPRQSTRSDVLATFDIEEADLEVLESLHLLSPGKAPDGTVVYGAVDLELLAVIDETRKRGLGRLFPMEILEPYVASVGELVRMELELFDRQVLDADAEGGQPVQQIAEQALGLGRKLVVALRNRLLLNEGASMGRAAARDAPSDPG